MFWIGFIVGMVVLALIGFGYIKWCFTVCGLNREDYHKLRDTIGATLDNRDSRIEVYDDDTNEKVFEAGFKYPWSDEED